MLMEMQFFSWEHVFNSTETQKAFDLFYESLNQILDRYFPQRITTITSRDPYYITPHIKQMLRQKNQLIRRGLIFKGDRGITNSADLWDKVRTITGKSRDKTIFEGFNAAGLNQHYAEISTDGSYIPPSKKLCCLPAANSRFLITPLSFLFALEALKPTSPGSDGIAYPTGC